MKSNFAQWLEAQYINWIGKEGKHKTPSEFAQWLGIHRSQLNMYLRGSQTPTGKNVDQLAGVLGMEVYDLLGLVVGQT